MNERIRELYGNALDKAVPYTWNNLDHVEVEKIVKEFAELIVKRCAEVADKYVRDGDVDIAEIIRRDFEVKK